MSRCVVHRGFIVLVLLLRSIAVVRGGGNHTVITHSSTYTVGKRFSTQSSGNETKSDIGFLPAPTTVGSSYCDNVLSCLNRDVYITLNDIIEHPTYELSERWRFERLPTLTVGVSSEEGGDKSTEMNGVTTMVLLKRVMDIFRTHSLRMRLLRNLELSVFRKVGSGAPKLAIALETNALQRGARTFGLMRRRIAYVLLAIMFKLGLMTAMLAMLIVLTVKGLKLGVLLLALTFANYTGKALPNLPFATIRPAEDPHSSVPPMHIHVHKDVSGPSGEWQPEPFSSFPQDMGGPYPYPASNSRLPYLPSLTSMRKTNPSSRPLYLEDDLRHAVSSHPAGNPQGYSVYYQKKNGQFYPVVINDVHRQNVDAGEAHDYAYSSPYRGTRRRDPVRRVEEEDEEGDGYTYERS